MNYIDKGFYIHCMMILFAQSLVFLCYLIGLEQNFPEKFPKNLIY